MGEEEEDKKKRKRSVANLSKSGGGVAYSPRSEWNRSGAEG